MKQKVFVWDLPLRLFHWSLVVSLCGLWFTAEYSYEQIHIYLGYFVLVLLSFRVLWGFFGTHYSKFSALSFNPLVVFSYLKNMLQGKAEESLGHNPVGGLMAIAVVLVIGAQAATGLFTEGELWSGPYYGTLDTDVSKFLNSLHHTLFDYILVLVAIHITAIFYYLLKKKQNLIMPMITGVKFRDTKQASDQDTGSRIVLALVLVTCVVAVVYWLVIINPPPVEVDDFYF